MSKMLVIQGLKRDVDLGLDFSENGKVQVLTKRENELNVLGNIDLTVANLSKLKSYRYVLMESTEGGVKAVEFDWEDIPRTQPEVKDSIKLTLERRGEDGIEF